MKNDKEMETLGLQVIYHTSLEELEKNVQDIEEYILNHF
jgi:hypothetical protein